MTRTCFIFLAVLVALTTHVTGQSNGALRVDGNNSALHVLRHPSLEPTEAITVEAWVKGEGSNSHGRIIRKGSPKGYMLSWSFQGNRLSGLMDCSGHKVAYDTAPNSDYLGEWHHLAMTSRPGGIIRFYIDGELVGMENAPLCQEHDSDLWFGAYTGVSEEFIGDIDEVRLWSVERTQAEIQASMNLVLEEAPGLISAWHLDGNGLDSVAENHGTLFGGAEFVASDAPVAFVTVPPRADWRGGETVLLSNVYGVQDPMPTVLFDGIPSPAVSRVLDQSLRAIVPPGKQPGARVAVEIVSPQVNVLSTQPFLYTPHLEGPTQGALGDEVELVLRFDPPAQIALARGGLLAGASPMQRYGWFLEIDRPVIAFSASAPTQRALTIPVKIPHVPELIGTPLAFQALVGPSFDGTNASFTNTHVLMVQPGPD